MSVPNGHGRMSILPALHSPDAIRAILECLGLRTRAPPIVPAEGESDDQRDAEGGRPCDHEVARPRGGAAAYDALKEDLVAKCVRMRYSP